MTKHTTAVPLNEMYLEIIKAVDTPETMPEHDQWSLVQPSAYEDIESRTSSNSFLPENFIQYNH